MTTPDTVDTVVLDLDGTLVDSDYEHVRAWKLAFQQVGIEVPAATLHRAIGMGGDRLVAAVAGEHVEKGVGDDVRSLHDRLFLEQIGDVRALPGASDLVRRIDESGRRAVLATSSPREHVERLLVLVESAYRLREVVTGEAPGASKPSADIVEQALDRAGSRAAVLVGDSVWDVLSAKHAGIPCLALTSGGLCATELTDAGALAVFEGPQELVGQFPGILQRVAPAVGA